MLTATKTDAMLAAARKAAEGLGVQIAVAIVDQGGILLAFHRMDGVKPACADAAEAKARSSALYHMRTSVFQARVHEEPGLLSVPHIVCAGGGVPIMDGAHCIGAIGCSGAIAVQDEAIAEAALAPLS